MWILCPSLVHITSESLLRLKVKRDEDLRTYRQLNTLLIELELLSRKSASWLRQTRTSEGIALVQRNLTETMNNFHVSQNLLYILVSTQPNFFLDSVHAQCYHQHMYPQI
jgi:hypothetical protein